jgi:hypothetical protein
MVEALQNGQEEQDVAELEAAVVGGIQALTKFIDAMAEIAGIEPEAPEDNPADSGE